MSSKHVKEDALANTYRRRSTFSQMAHPHHATPAAVRQPEKSREVIAIRVSPFRVSCRPFNLGLNLKRCATWFHGCPRLDRRITANETVWMVGFAFKRPNCALITALIPTPFAMIAKNHSLHSNNPDCRRFRNEISGYRAVAMLYESWDRFNLDSAVFAAW